MERCPSARFGFKPRAASRILFGQQLDAVRTGAPARAFGTERALKNMGSDVVGHDAVVVDRESDRAIRFHTRRIHGVLGRNGLKCVPQHIDKHAAEQCGVGLESRRLRIGRNPDPLIVSRSEHLTPGGGITQL